MLTVEVMSVNVPVVIFYCVFVCLFVCYSPGLEAEAVLDEHSDGEEDHALHSHGKEVFAYHVPGQWGAEPVLSCRSKPQCHPHCHVISTTATSHSWLFAHFPYAL